MTTWYNQRGWSTTTLLFEILLAESIATAIAERLRTNRKGQSKATTGGRHQVGSTALGVGETRSVVHLHLGVDHWGDVAEEDSLLPEERDS